MIDHPLLFTSEMVRVVLEGRKSQTRRVPVERYRNWKVGELIWVRETWCLGSGSWPGYKTYTEPTTKGRGGAIYPVLYRANQLANDADHKWKSSIHMFRKYARIWLEITGLREERVQEISLNDCNAEGASKTKHIDEWNARHHFAKLWDSLNAKRGYGWDKNPEVKVIKFKRVQEYS